MSACIRCHDIAHFCAHHAGARETELRQEVKELKSRLKEVRRQCKGREQPYSQYLLRVTDLRMKNWEET